MAAARIALAWELGLSIGHATALARLGVRLRERGHDVGLFLRDLDALRFLPESRALEIFQAPRASSEGLWGGPPLSYAEILKGCGYAYAEGLGSMLDGWRGHFAAWKPDLVVADFAPTALLAAQDDGHKARDLRQRLLHAAARDTAAAVPHRPARGPCAPRSQLDAEVLATVNAVLSSLRRASPRAPRAAVRGRRGLPLHLSRARPLRRPAGVRLVGTALLGRGGTRDRLAFGGRQARAGLRAAAARDAR